MTARAANQTLDPPPSGMDEDQFLMTFAEVYEHSPWIAEKVWQQGVGARHDTVEGMYRALAQVFLNAPRLAQLQVLRAHPDLAGRVSAREGPALTEASGREQASAGLTACSADQVRRFQELNRAYKRKFDFPFIMAVRGSTPAAILAAFTERLDNDPNTEFTAALREVNKIAKLRLLALARPSPEE